MCNTRVTRLSYRESCLCHTQLVSVPSEVQAADRTSRSRPTNKASESVQLSGAPSPEVSGGRRVNELMKTAPKGMEKIDRDSDSDT